MEISNNGDVMEKLKIREMSILKSFIKVCDKLKLQYFALGGTCLGAARHSGFIPWDDDIDLGMKRADFEIFIKEGQKYLPEEMFIQTRTTDPEYKQNFAKIRLSSTTFIETAVKNDNINHGVFIDIFPVDYCPDNEKEYRKLWSELRKCGRITGNSFTIKDVDNRLMNRIFTSSTMKGTVRRALDKNDRLIKRTKHSTLMANFCGAWGEKEVVPAEIFDNVVSVKFEDIEINVPWMYREYLTYIYGDYMQLPPEDKRVAHHYTEVIDLDKPYTEYIKKK